MDGVCWLEVEVGVGHIHLACGIVHTDKNGVSIQGYIVVEVDEKCTIHLLSNELVSLSKEKI